MKYCVNKINKIQRCPITDQLKSLRISTEAFQELSKIGSK